MIFFLLRLIILIVNVIYILELYLRIFFESVPKVNFSRAELIFQPGFWEYCQPKVTQVIFGLAFQVHGRCGFWPSNYKNLCEEFHWRHLFLFSSLYFFSFHTKLRLRKMVSPWLSFRERLFLVHPLRISPWWSWLSGRGLWSNLLFHLGFWLWFLFTARGKWCWQNWTATYPSVKLEYSLTLCTKINSKWLKDLNIRHDIIKFL